MPLLILEQAVMATGCQNVEDVMLTPKAGYSFAKDANLTRWAIQELHVSHSILNSTLWQFMRDNSLSNWVFKSYEDIVDHCCYAGASFNASLGASCPSATKKSGR